jgi:methionyl-tRNA formyltransferase
MKIAVLCTNTDHPVLPRLQAWCRDMQQAGHAVSLHSRKADLQTGDVLFLVSCGEIIEARDRARFDCCLVLHASDLPRGRGWSPHVWAILGGATSVTVSLLEASDPVDSGAVWLKREFTLEGHELLDEINEKLFEAELTLMSEAVSRFGQIRPVPQQGDPGVYLRRRTPLDSQLDPNRTIAEQFDLLRVVDNSRYPAFFEYRGKTYFIRIDKDADDR